MKTGIIGYNDIIKYLDGYDVVYYPELDEDEDYKDFQLLIIYLSKESDSLISKVKKINKMYSNCKIIYLVDKDNYNSKIYDTNHIYCLTTDEIEKNLPNALNKAFGEIKYIIISWKKEDFKIKVQDILYIERNMRTTKIITKYRTYSTALKIQNVLDLLPDSFIKIHQSFGINMNHLKDIRKNDLIMEDDTILPVSRSQKKIFRHQYEDFLINKN